MGLSEVNEDGTMWFLTNEYSCKANEIEAHPKVNNQVFTDTKKQIYVTISGMGRAYITDQSKNERTHESDGESLVPERNDRSEYFTHKGRDGKAAYWTKKQ